MHSNEDPAQQNKTESKMTKKYPENLEALLNFPLLTIYKLSRIRSFSRYAQGVPIVYIMLTNTAIYLYPLFPIF